MGGKSILAGQCVVDPQRKPRGKKIFLKNIDFRLCWGNRATTQNTHLKLEFFPRLAHYYATLKLWLEKGIYIFLWLQSKSCQIFSIVKFLLIFTESDYLELTFRICFLISEILTKDQNILVSQLPEHSDSDVNGHITNEKLFGVNTENNVTLGNTAGQKI